MDVELLDRDVAAQPGSMPPSGGTEQDRGITGSRLSTRKCRVLQTRARGERSSLDAPRYFDSAITWGIIAITTSRSNLKPSARSIYIGLLPRRGR
jgi:hypothetical protein